MTGATGGIGSAVALVAFVILSFCINAGVRLPCYDVCGTDIGHDYEDRGIDRHHPPFFDRNFEYPPLIGEVWSNPAIMSNLTYTVMLENCRCAHPTEFDGAEDIITKLVPVAEIPGLVASGKIRHSLVVVALYHFELWRRGLKK